MTQVDSTDEVRPNSRPPSSWWHTVLMYPALAIALITAVPDWLDRLKAWRQDLTRDYYHVAVQQREFWHKNFECTQSRFDLYEAADGVMIDGLICPSGDLFLRVDVGDETISHGIFLADIIEQSTLPETATLNLGDIFGLYAQAAPLSSPDPAPASETPRAKVELAQVSAVVSCQAFQPDQRTIKRGIRAAAQCFNEYVDTFTGRVVRTEPINCIDLCR